MHMIVAGHGLCRAVLRSAGTRSGLTEQEDQVVYEVWRRAVAVESNPDNLAKLRRDVHFRLQIPPRFMKWGGPNGMARPTMVSTVTKY